MTTTKRWLAGAGASAVLLLGVAVPALASDDTTAPSEATEQSSDGSREATPGGGHDCANRGSGEAPSDTAPSEAAPSEA